MGKKSASPKLILFRQSQVTGKTESVNFPMPSEKIRKLCNTLVKLFTDLWGLTGDQG